MSLTKVSYSMIQGAPFSVFDYGAVANGVVSPPSGTDNGPAFRAALLAAAQAGGGVVDIPHGTYRVTTTVIIPRDVTVRGNGSTIVGPGIGSATDLFQSGYYNGSAIVTNIGTAPETQTVVFSVNGLVVYNCGKAFNFYNVIFGSVFSQLSINDCTYSMYLDRCFYASFHDITSRGSASGATNAAIYLAAVNNVMDFSSVFVNGRVLGIQISGGANGLKLYNCAAESCETGIYITNETGPIAFDTCYFENILTGAAIAVNIDTQFAKKEISFTNCFFNGCTTGIKMPTDGNTQSRVIVDSTNRFNNCTNFINSSTTTIFLQNKISYTKDAIASGYALLPSEITVGKGDIVDIDQMFYDSSTATPAARTKTHGQSLIPWNVEGNGGYAPGFSVPFCAYSQTGSGASCTLIIDTKMVYDKHSSLLVYRLTIDDVSTTVELRGFIFGDTVQQLDAVGKTFVVSNNGGYVRLSISNFNTTINPKGFLRFI
jgi:hypothetical protein